MKTALIYGEAVAVIVVVSVPIHYLGGLDWPWAIVIGAATSVVLRWLIHGGILARLRKRPLIGH
jgi:predicted aconitase with swiveling domain